jgi:Ras family protein A
VAHFCPNIPIVLVGCKKDLRTDAKTIEELAQNGLQPVSDDQVINQIYYYI